MKSNMEYNASGGRRVAWIEEPKVGERFINTFGEEVVFDEISLGGMMACTDQDGMQSLYFPQQLTPALPAQPVLECVGYYWIGEDNRQKFCGSYDTIDIETAMQAEKVYRYAAPALPAQPVAWDKFPGWLIDHHEGETLTEEMLQQALANMLAALPAAQPGEKS